MVPSHMLWRPECAYEGDLERERTRMKEQTGERIACYVGSTAPGGGGEFSHASTLDRSHEHQHEYDACCSRTPRERTRGRAGIVLRKTAHEHQTRRRRRLPLKGVGRTILVARGFAKNLFGEDPKVSRNDGRESDSSAVSLKPLPPVSMLRSDHAQKTRTHHLHCSPHPLAPKQQGGHRPFRRNAQHALRSIRRLCRGLA
eukprot:scaffold143876_cov32-Tisochrysis_lutea.AAC.4